MALIIMGFCRASLPGKYVPAAPLGVGRPAFSGQADSHRNHIIA